MKLIDLRHLNWTIQNNEPGTAGSFIKTSTMENGKRYFYKLSRFDSYEMKTIGIESVNEVIVDRILNLLQIRHVHYQLIHALIKIGGKEVITDLCKSKDFKEENEMSISIGSFFKLQKHFNASLKNFMDLIKLYHWEEEIYDMLITDFLILNRDRHDANFEIIRDDHGNYRPAPLFDHGLSLIINNDIDPLGDYKCQTFIGSYSTHQNLNLIDKSYLHEWYEQNRFIKEENYSYLFNDLEVHKVLHPEKIRAIWEIIYLRSEWLKEYIEKVN